MLGRKEQPMTEAEWLACKEPFPMLDALRNEARDRRLRLFSTGCCRRLWHRLPDDRCRTALETCERYADGAASKAELTDARIAATAASFEFDERPYRPQAAGSVARAACSDEYLWQLARSVAIGVAQFHALSQRVTEYLVAELGSPRHLRQPVSLRYLRLSGRYSTPRCPFLPTRSKTRAVTTRTCYNTAADRVRTSADVGWWTWHWARND